MLHQLLFWNTFIENYFFKDVDSPHGDKGSHVQAVPDLESGCRKFMLDRLRGNDKAVLVAFPYSFCLQAFASPGLVIAVYPQGNANRIPGYAMKFLQQSEPIVRLANMMNKSHAKNAVDRIVRQFNVECGCL